MRAKKINGSEEWMGVPITLDPAPEPTDIIWENRHFTESEKLIRLLITIGVIFLFLGVTFFTIFYLKKYLQANNHAINVNCDDISSLYRDDNHF